MHACMLVSRCGQATLAHMLQLSDQEIRVCTLEMGAARRTGSLRLRGTLNMRSSSMPCMLCCPPLPLAALVSPPAGLSGAALAGAASCLIPGSALIAADPSAAGPAAGMLTRPLLGSAAMPWASKGAGSALGAASEAEVGGSVAA